MAKMVPRRPLPTCSHAEVALFERLRDELPASWVVLHSVGIANHDRKPWAEIDFVAVGPPGVLCIEVKGGAVSRRHGEWWFGSNKKREGPFEQSKTAHFALRSYLTEADRRLEDILMGWCVLLPDCSLDARGPDILREVLIDGGDIETSLDVSLRRCLQHWHDKLARTHYVDKLSPSLVGRVVELVRGDFESEVLARTYTQDVNRQQLELTETQRQTALGLVLNPRVWVTGTAGTGKTVLAVDEARRLASAGEEVLLLCYNRRLGQWLARSLVDAPSVTVRTIHKLATELGGNGYGYEDRYEGAVEEALAPALELGARYTAVVVDEGQDLLRTSHIDLVDALLDQGLMNGTWRWFSDHNQDIFGRSDDDAVELLEAARPVHFRLSTNCRNTLQIAKATQELTGIEIEETRGATGPDVVLHPETDDVQRTVVRIVRRLLDQGLEPEQVRVLLTREAWGMVSTGDVGHGTSLVVTQAGQDPLDEPRTVEICGTGTFKGLEADAVILVAPKEDGQDWRRQTYVGATRAKVVLHVIH